MTHFLRSHDHQIPLKEGAQALRVSICSKHRIKKLVNEMLDSGIVQRNNSSFAFPILPIKEKDGTWKIYVDYGQLNDFTQRTDFLWHLLVS